MKCMSYHPYMVRNYQAFTLIKAHQFIGGNDQLKPINADIWVDAMLTEGQSPPPFYPSEFKEWADGILGQSNIDSHDVRDLYLYLSSQAPPTFLQ